MRDPTWMDSLGGPLVVVPVSATQEWLGANGTGLVTAGDDDTDCDRACGVDGLAGTIAFGTNGQQALVLADEPARTCYLPEHRAFVRWIAARSDSELIQAATAVLANPATAWHECGTWETDGPAVLMHGITAGSELYPPHPDWGIPEHVAVAIPAARWVVRAVVTHATKTAWVSLVQLTR